MSSLVALLILLVNPCWASFDLGVGTSSITAGRPTPALAIGIEGDSWGAQFRSVGVRTTVYAQNAWVLAGHPLKYSENMGPLDGTISAGLGTAYMLRSYRDSPSAATQSTSEYAVGPHVALKVRYGPVYIGFDTLLGITSQVVQHIVLNFQDVSHVTVGISL